MPRHVSLPGLLSHPTSSFSRPAINALTGANTYACNFLIPVGIAVYVITGGLRATFMSDYVHTVIIFICIYAFMFRK